MNLDNIKTKRGDYYWTVWKCLNAVSVWFWMPVTLSRHAENQFCLSSLEILIQGQVNVWIYKFKQFVLWREQITFNVLKGGWFN